MNFSILTGIHDFRDGALGAFGLSVMWMKIGKFNGK